MSTILITGATSGLGRYVASELVRSGHLVLAHGRDPERTERLVEELRAEGVVADLASPARVRELGDRVAGAHPELDVLVNNAGVGGGPRGSRRGEPRRARTAAGGQLLGARRAHPLPAARAARPSDRKDRRRRLGAGQEPLDFDDPGLTRGHSGVSAYCRSKFALAAHTFALARAEEERGGGVAVNVLHPATCTAMVREGGIAPWNTVADGSAGVLALITEDVGTGGYFDGTLPARAHEAAYDPETHKRLTAVTEQLLSV